MVASPVLISPLLLMASLGVRLCLPMVSNGNPLSPVFIYSGG